MSKNRNYKVYVHINKINGKRYYGITKQKVKKRWINGNGYKNNEHFWNSICKYGWNEGFEHIVIAKGLSEEEAKWLEVELIKEWNTTDCNKGYNITNGGEGTNGYSHTEESRKKISENNAMAKAVYIIELDMTFDTVTECARFLECSISNISDVLNGKGKTVKNYHIIYYKDKNNKELIDEVMQYDGQCTKAVYVVELDKVFDSVTECARFLGCDRRRVSKVVNGENKTIKKYHIIYAKDKNNEELINEVMNYEYRKQVYIIELDKVFDSISECARFLGCHKSNVSAVLNGRHKTCKGYHITYAKDKLDKDKLAS